MSYHEFGKYLALYAQSEFQNLSGYCSIYYMASDNKNCFSDTADKIDDM